MRVSRSFRLWLMSGLAAIWMVPAAAQSETQSETLADIKQDLAVLTVEIRRLTRELSTTGASGVQVAGAPLDRVAAIEAELQRVIAKTEELEFRIGQVAKDGANRIGDLQFRICELEPGCDIGALDMSDPLGGVETSAPVPSAPAPSSVASGLPSFEGELAFAEESDFLAAQAALDAGDFGGAAQQFAAFEEAYPGSPLMPFAFLGAGRALEAQGDTRAAARRYLATYSSFPDAQAAPEALWRLGVALSDLGARDEACTILAEVPRDYPGSAAVAKAAETQRTLSCP